MICGTQPPMRGKAGLRVSPGLERTAQGGGARITQCSLLGIEKHTRHCTHRKRGADPGVRLVQGGPVARKQNLLDTTPSLY